MCVSVCVYECVCVCECVCVSVCECVCVCDVLQYEPGFDIQTPPARPRTVELPFHHFTPAAIDSAGRTEQMGKSGCLDQFQDSVTALALATQQMRVRWDEGEVAPTFRGGGGAVELRQRRRVFLEWWVQRPDPWLVMRKTRG